MNAMDAAPPPAPVNQEVMALVTQAQAPDLGAVTAASGVTALTPVQTPDELSPVRPDHLTDETEREIIQAAEDFIELVKADPSDWKLGDYIFKLGNDIMESTKIQVSLYDSKMGNVLNEVSEGDSPVGRDILAIKTQLDMVNPVMVQSKEISVSEKFMRLFTKTISRLPNTDEVIRMIAERRETVRSTIDGIRVHMMQESDKIIKDASELGIICDSLKDLQPAL
ncbi:MAG: tellurite resistance protein, partial [Desulfobacterales bacterium]|nr:tellurite resistance protein [Desulfobacterales bacterium]